MAQSAKHLKFRRYPTAYWTTATFPVQAATKHCKKPNDGQAPYRIVQQDENQHAMIGLRDRGSDHLSLTCSRGDVAVGDLVIELPHAFQRVELVSMEGCPPGRSMTQLELDKYGPPEVGFHLKGWRGEGLKRDQRFGVVLRLPAR